MKRRGAEEDSTGGRSGPEPSGQAPILSTDGHAEQADVVVLGGGPGGCAAALTAARRGAKTILLEALDRVGGNAARSTGYMAFANFGAQHEAGITDSAQNYLADMKNEIALQQERYGVIFDDALAARYAEESAATYDFLTDIGFGFNRFVPRPRQHTTTRMMDVLDVSMFTTCFESALAEENVSIRCLRRGRRLIVDNGRVVGVRWEEQAPEEEAESQGASGEVYAHSGVILAAGGYQANGALRSRYQPNHLAYTPYLGVETDRGDGHLMGQALGGDLINMTMIPPLVMVASALVENSIAVDCSGKRFHDEAGPYDERVEALNRTPGRRAFYIFDDRTADEKAVLISQMPSPAVCAPTLEELADLIDCPPEALLQTVDKWNRMVALDAKTDPDFGRVVFPEGGDGILKPPFWASPMVVGINFPAGGFRVSLDCEVFDVFGKIIPGLFAVGDCVGGIAPAIGLGGVKIGSAVTLGRIAGRAVTGGGTTKQSEPSVAAPSEAEPTTDAPSPRMHIVG